MFGIDLGRDVMLLTCRVDSDLVACILYTIAYIVVIDVLEVFLNDIALHKAIYLLYAWDHEMEVFVMMFL